MEEYHIHRTLEMVSPFSKSNHTSPSPSLLGFHFHRAETLIPLLVLSMGISLCRGGSISTILAGNTPDLPSSHPMHHLPSQPSGNVMPTIRAPVRNCSRSPPYPRGRSSFFAPCRWFFSLLAVALV